MVIRLAFILFLAWPAFGQFKAFYGNDQPFLGNVVTNVGGGAPPATAFDNVTNLAGYPIRSFYLVSQSGGVVTNGGNTIQLTDFSTNTFHQTNMAATSKWPVRQSGVAAINNHDSILFDGSAQYLNCRTYTNNKISEVVMVLRWNDDTNAANRYISQYVTVAGFAIQQGTASQLICTSSGALTDGKIITNKWYVLDFVVNGASGMTIYTNNTQAATTASAQTAAPLGMTLGIDHFISGSCAPIDLAAMAIYGSADGSAAIPGTNTTARASVFSAFTNYFNLSP